MNNNFVSFIVPVFNKLEHTKSMYISLQDSLPQGLAYEIIFINDFSTDQTKNWLSSLNNPRVKYFSNSINLGYAKSNNLGANKSSGNILCFLNNDLIFESDWFRSMLEIYESFKNSIGLLGNIQYKVSDKTIDHAGVILHMNGQFKHLKYLNTNNSNISRVFAVTGACILIAKSIFNEVGGFDENYLNGSEDFDLCFKLRSLGKDILIDNKSFIYHYVGLTRGDDNFLNEKNTRYFFNKWRKEIRRELSNKWANALKNNLPEIYEVIDGHLTEPFMSTYNNASLLIGENIVLKHEHRWSKLIDDIDQNSNLSKNLKFEGLRFSHTLNHYLLTDKASVILSSNIKSIVNFYICGRKIDTNNHDSILLTIYVNNIQYKTIELNDISSNVNEGIISPLLLSGVANIFKFQFHYFNVLSKELKGDASSAIYISHFVIDDKEIKPIN